MRFRKLKQKTKPTKQDNKRNKTVYKYASTPDRIKAFITDMFMIYIPILYFITYVVMDGRDEFVSSTLAPLLGVVLYGLIYTILLYKFGQTPGKKAYQIKVLDAITGKNITLFQALFRFISFLFSATFLLGLLVGLYRKDRRSLHDLMAGTVVVAL
ncbi:MAG: RDD family protein [Sulfurimonas sp.]|nr:RDD family protein [Sulfurimonas sp.]